MKRDNALAKVGSFEDQLKEAKIVLKQAMIALEEHKDATVKLAKIAPFFFPFILASEWRVLTMDVEERIN